jgi:hypothetical protein
MGLFDFIRNPQLKKGFKNLIDIADMGRGNVYIVAGSGSSSYSELAAKYEGCTYDDGSAMFYPHVSTASTVTTNGLKNALAATVEDRNDYVIVMPANATYYINEALAMNKKGVHLICPAGLGYDIGATNAARIQQIGNYPIIAVTDAAVEIAGLYLKQMTGYAGITLGTGTAYAPNIHHNTFPLIWIAAAIGSIIGAGDAGAWGKIERNWFISQSGGAQTCAAGIIQIQSAATGAQVNHNQIDIGDTQIATIGISNAAVKGHTDFNIFSECGGSGVADGGTITKCVSIHASGSAIGNRGAVGTGQLLTGGTASHSFCNNFDGVAGGETANLEA